MGKHKYDYSLENEPMELLTRAIVKQAAEDFRTARSYIFVYQDKGEEILQKLNNGESVTHDDELYLAKYQENLELLEECEAFFTGDWGETLSGVSGDMILEHLREETIRPIRISNRIIGRLRKEENEKSKNGDNRLNDILAHGIDHKRGDGSVSDSREDVSYFDEGFSTFIDDDF